MPSLSKTITKLMGIIKLDNSRKQSNNITMQCLKLQLHESSWSDDDVIL